MAHSRWQNLNLNLIWCQVTAALFEIRCGADGRPQVELKFATTKPALVHEYREELESDRAWDIEQTLQKRILKEIWRWA